MSIITDIINGGVKGIGDAAKEVIQTFKADPTQLAQIDQAEKTLDEKLEEVKININAQIEQAYLKDVEDARNREIQIATSDKAPLLNKIITPILALVVTLGGGTLFYLSKTADERTALIGVIMLCLGYYFGSSSGSAAKEKTINDMINK